MYFVVFKFNTNAHTRQISKFHILYKSWRRGIEEGLRLDTDTKRTRVTIEMYLSQSAAPRAIKFGCQSLLALKRIIRTRPKSSATVFTVLTHIFYV